MMPGEWDWMNRMPWMRGPGGFRTPGIFAPPPPSPGGLFGTEQQGDPAMDARMAFAAQLLAGSGPSPVRKSFGQLVGEATQAGQQAKAQSQQRSFENDMQRRQVEMMEAYRKSQAEAAANPVRKPIAVLNEQGQPVYVDEQEAIGKTPYAGAGGANTTADIQNWEYFKKLSPDDQKAWISQQRQPTVPQLTYINGVPTLVNRVDGTMQPLSTQEATFGAEQAAASAKAKGAATGGAAGEAEGAIDKRRINAKTVLDTLEMADPLIDIATGSATGAAVDKVAGFFGSSTDGAKATAQLKILQAGLMLNMPRMEGPQSDRDVQLYRDAAGALGDPTVPRETKKAAVQTIRDIQRKYADGSASSTTGAPSGAPAIGTVKGGYRFKGGNPADKNNWEKT